MSNLKSQPPYSEMLINLTQQQCTEADAKVSRLCFGTPKAKINVDNQLKLVCLRCAKSMTVDS